VDSLFKPKEMNSCRVYTPPPLASAMTRALCHQQGNLWLEPSFGRGAFVDEIAALGVERKSVVGVDLDRRKSKSDLKCLPIRGTDFLSWSIEESTRFDRIVGNPPFIAIERLREPLRGRAAETRWGSLKSLGLNGNLWASFLMATLRVLNEGGHLSLVLPAAWGYADYAADLRLKLPSLFREFVCHRSKQPLFDSVQDGCYVIQCFGFGEKNRITSSHVYERGEDLIKGLRPPVRPSAPAIRTCDKAPSEKVCKAGDLFQVRLGAVTGDANYFLLSEARRRELGLPESCLIPVVTRARHLTAPSIRKSVWNQIRDSGDRAYLFSPQGTNLSHESVNAYLRLIHEKGGCNRAAGWVKKRTPWYSVDVPNHFDGFMSGVNTNGAWIALNAMEELAATNTLYGIRFDTKLKSRDAKAACSLSLLTSYSRSQLAARTRNYAAGMRKLEPSDITGITYL
jgi:adenine-specific DNA-methyltransferase